MNAISEDVYTVDEIKDKVTPVLKEHNVKKAILFGSYANSEAREKSDIDILVDSGLRGLSFFELVADVQEVLQKEVDLIDVREIVRGSKIDVEIAKTGVVIYAQ
ncbi:MAG: nucleotidyltransferase domain-containing protein [Synergistaceae bacterium]|jgi:predicted nucleotidyltransferase|nr:nucleotidyltransferase domain-containing protein [Synergistaceae bacterium]